MRLQLAKVCGSVKIYADNLSGSEQLRSNRVIINMGRAREESIRQPKLMTLAEKADRFTIPNPSVLQIFSKCGALQPGLAKPPSDLTFGSRWASFSDSPPPISS